MKNRVKGVATGLLCGAGIGFIGGGGIFVADGFSSYVDSPEEVEANIAQLEVKIDSDQEQFDKVQAGLGEVCRPLMADFLSKGILVGKSDQTATNLLYSFPGLPCGETQQTIMKNVVFARQSEQRLLDAQTAMPGLEANLEYSKAEYQEPIEAEPFLAMSTGILALVGGAIGYGLGRKFEEE